MLEKFFHLKENHTDVKTEIMAGVTSFMTMAYILAVNPNILGDELIITAMSEDGVVEAIEMIDPWCEFVLGVQFHPENLANKGNARCKKIFQRFVEAAARHAGK